MPGWSWFWYKIKKTESKENDSGGGEFTRERITYSG